jgi:hypothetical protein
MYAAVAAAAKKAAGKKKGRFFEGNFLFSQ